MDRISKIDEKIKKLSLKKEKLQSKEAEDLYKTLQKIMKEDFSPALVLGRIAETFKDPPSSQQKEAWLKAVKPFWGKKEAREPQKN